MENPVLAYVQFFFYIFLQNLYKSIRADSNKKDDKLVK